VTHINFFYTFPTFYAAHQADVCGPPMGRGPQVENRCSKRHCAHVCAHRSGDERTQENLERT